MDKLQHDQYAAVDLGSNSFHMVVARVEKGQLRVVDKLREQVQLGLGMSDDKRIHPDAWRRGLDCLATFGQRLRGIPAANCRVVGTNTLRRAINGAEFVAEGKALLGHGIEIIAGREEARLIYEGVLHNTAEPNIPRLVIDIGGGSTELIVGNGFDPSLMESISAGCVSASQQFFDDGAIDSHAFRDAINATLMELHPTIARYRTAQWDEVVGCSGTIKAVAKVTAQLGYSDGDGFDHSALERLAAHMRSKAHVDHLDYEGLPERRLRVLPGGVAVLLALFKGLKIERLRTSETALREGVIYDLYGIQHHIDVQLKTLIRLAQQYSIDTAQAGRVAQVAEHLAGRADKALSLKKNHVAQLSYAAQLYEVGWVVAHSQYHKHGHYLLANADMPGFSRNEQQRLANLVRFHRRKLPMPLTGTFGSVRLQMQLLLLRLAVIITRDRRDTPPPPVSLGAGVDGQVYIHADATWLERHPLTTAELHQECDEWRKVGHSVSLVIEN